jgi:hypothetical protein
VERLWQVDDGFDAHQLLCGRERAWTGVELGASESEQAIEVGLWTLAQASCKRPLWAAFGVRLVAAKTLGVRVS